MQEIAGNQGVDKSSFFTAEKLNANLGGKGTASNVTYSETGDSTLTYLPTDGNLAYNMKITSDGQIIIVGEPTAPGGTVASSGQTLASQITSAIGSPTVEMWMASWNQKYTDTLVFDANTTGYNVGLTEGSLSNYIDGSKMQAKQGFKDSLYYPHGNTSENSWNDCYGYWLASPSASSTDHVMNVCCNGDVFISNHYDDSIYGVRPVVSLSSGIKGTATTTDGITTWNISK